MQQPIFDIEPYSALECRLPDGHDPCQHSLALTMCCVCAGCMRDVSDCRRGIFYTTFADQVRRWATHPLMLVIEALLCLLVLTSGLLDLLWLMCQVAFVAGVLLMGFVGAEIYSSLP